MLPCSPRYDFVPPCLAMAGILYLAVAQGSTGCYPKWWQNGGKNGVLFWQPALLHYSLWGNDQLGRLKLFTLRLPCVVAYMRWLGHGPGKKVSVEVMSYIPSTISKLACRKHIAGLPHYVHILNFEDVHSPVDKEVHQVNQVRLERISCPSTLTPIIRLEFRRFTCSAVVNP